MKRILTLVLIALGLNAFGQQHQMNSELRVNSATTVAGAPVLNVNNWASGFQGKMISLTAARHGNGNAFKYLVASDMNGTKFELTSNGSSFFYGNMGIGAQPTSDYKLGVTGLSKLQHGEKNAPVLNLNNYRSTNDKYTGSLLQLSCASEGQFSSYNFIAATPLHSSTPVFTVNSRGNIMTNGTQRINSAYDETLLNINTSRNNDYTGQMISLTANTNGGSGDFSFFTASAWNEKKIDFKSNGNAYFEGGLFAREVKIAVEAWPDYVFNDDYDLKSLEEVEEYIHENNHLPGIAKANEIEKNGLELGQMDVKIVEKIEELTLYIIEMNKQLKTQELSIEILKQENRELRNLK